VEHYRPSQIRNALVSELNVSHALAEDIVEAIAA
jgi:hypothetical protein